MIKLQVIGHLGKDCVVNTANQKSVINFSVAHSEKYRDAQGVQMNKSIWVDCSYWSDKVAVAPYLKQGTPVFVEGTPEVRTYQTRDGKTGASLSLRVLSVQLLGGQKEGGSNQQQGQSNQGGVQQSGGGNSYSDNSSIGDTSEDLPF